MSLPWLRDDYKRPESRSRSRSSSRSRGRPKSEDKRSRSRSRSPRSTNSRDFQPRGRDPGRGRGGKRKRSGSSSSASSDDSRSSTTRLVASSRPKYVNARIFVANITSKEVTKAEIVKHFDKYGNVVDCLIHPKNYIFVQYLKEEHARLAVEGTHGSTLNGYRIDVKMANENRKGGGQQQNRDQRRDPMGYPMGGRNNEPGGRPPRDRGDRDRERDRDRDDRGGPPPRDSYGPDPFIHDRRPPPPFPPPGGEFGMRDPYFPPPPDPYRRGFPQEPWLPPDDPYRRDPFADPFRDPRDPRDPFPARAPPPGPVECEVFIVNSQLRTYGEIIERKVKDQSIITNLSILPEGRTAPQLVEELTVKNGLFAIFLNAQNEVHRSLTLNILHGTPQEHRNMPMEDAISLVGRSFEKYVEELRAKANADNAPPASSGGAGGGSGRVFLPPSSEVTYLLNLLADNRALTVAELDTVINYLQERREKLIDADGRSSISDGKDAKNEKKKSDDKSRESNKEKEKEKDVQETHEELTKKILSIFQGVDPSIASKLTQSSSSVAQVPAPQPAPAPTPSERPSTSGSGSGGGGSNLINFDNPNVQQALNNLIQSGPDLLKSFTSSNSPPRPSAGIVSSRINPAPVLSSADPTMMGPNGQGIPTSHGGPMGMGMGGGMPPEMMAAMGMQMQGGNDMGMGMFGPQPQYDSNVAALAAANLAAFNMHGMAHQMGMGGQDFGNYPPMPMGGGGGGGPPPPPPPDQNY